MNVTIFSTKMLTQLAGQARSSIRKRQHLNIHRSHEEACQRLLNAIGPDSYIRPHRHTLDPKTETLFAISGDFALVLFEDGGEPKQFIRFGAGDQGSSPNVGVELPPGSWHTVLALTAGAVLLEIKAGPFVPGAAKEFAPWAPEEGSDEASRYLSSLRKLVQLAAEPTSIQAVDA